MDDAKYEFFVFNTCFTISGLGILTAGIIVLSDVNEFKHFLEGRVIAFPIVLIVTGAMIFLIASFGCYGAIKESPTMLKKFVFLLLIFSVIELTVGITAAAFKSNLETTLHKSMRSSIERSSKADLLAWDYVQQRFQCCGMNGTSNWRNYTSSPSCYYLYQVGCLKKFELKLDWDANVLIVAGLSLSFVPLFGILIADWLTWVIRKRNTEDKFTTSCPSAETETENSRELHLSLQLHNDQSI